jgi:hypothetical protein
MKVADLVAEQIGPWKRKLFEGRLIAIDSMTDKVLFDTVENTRKHVETFFGGEVAALWADVCVENSYPTPSVRPCLKCCVRHDSWKGGWNE